MAVKPEYTIKGFATAEAFTNWLEKNHASSPGIWLRIAKKASGKKSVTYPEAVEIALCYGWIDGQKKPHTDTTWLQKFTPRAKRSMWSGVNQAKVAALIQSGRMRPAGLREVERAKADGRWARAYAPASAAKVPKDFQKELDKSPRAQAAFAGFNAANRYAVIWRIETAKKPETRSRRISALIEMLEKGEKLH